MLRIVSALVCALSFAFGTPSAAEDYAASPYQYGSGEASSFADYELRGSADPYLIENYWLDIAEAAPAAARVEALDNSAAALNGEVLALDGAWDFAELSRSGVSSETRLQGLRMMWQLTAAVRGEAEPTLEGQLAAAPLYDDATSSMALSSAPAVNLAVVQPQL